MRTNKREEITLITKGTDTCPALRPIRSDPHLVSTNSADCNLAIWLLVLSGHANVVGMLPLNREHSLVWQLVFQYLLECPSLCCGQWIGSHKICAHRTLQNDLQISIKLHFACSFIKYFDYAFSYHYAVLLAEFHS